MSYLMMASDEQTAWDQIAALKSLMSSSLWVPRHPEIVIESQETGSPKVSCRCSTHDKTGSHMRSRAYTFA